MPTLKGFTARPTTDAAKESLFNILFNYFDFEEKQVLDLFAGSGGISYEFASRGCAHVTAVEKDFKHVSYINKVVDELKIQEITVLKGDVFKFIASCHSKFNIIFVDPPYDLPELENLADTILSKELLVDNGMLVIEHPKGIDFSKHPRFMLHKHYGSVNFSFFE